jgi:hypothetical protein
MPMIISLVLIFNFPIYPIGSKVCQRSHFLEVDNRELEDVNMGSHRSNKDVEIEAKNTFNEWRWFHAYETNMSIVDLLDKEESIKGLVDMFHLFVLQVAEKDNMYPLTKYFFFDLTSFFQFCLFVFVLKLVF